MQDSDECILSLHEKRCMDSLLQKLHPWMNPHTALAGLFDQPSHFSRAQKQSQKANSCKQEVSSSYRPIASVAIRTDFVPPTGSSAPNWQHTSPFNNMRL